MVRDGSWKDRLEVDTVGEGEAARRVITLTGRPTLRDIDKGELREMTAAKG